MGERRTETRRSWRATVLVGLVGVACAPNPDPIPVIGPGGSIAALVGSWVGTYESRETGRSGTLELVLSAGQDTAYGDVLMVPRGWDRALRAATGPNGRLPPAPEGLRVQFVRVEGGSVSGYLEAYRDPECGCVLTTTFRGELEGNRILGTYLSRSMRSGAQYRGTWPAQPAWLSEFLKVLGTRIEV